jgi:hypothetical protein
MAAVKHRCQAPMFHAYGVAMGHPADDVGGTLLLLAGAGCGSYTWRRRPPGHAWGVHAFSGLRLGRPPKRPAAVWLWVVAAWIALFLFATAASAEAHAIWGGVACACAILVAIVEMRG